MKKIIAMLLCVALVAAMGVSAFAAGNMGSTLPDKASKTEIFSVEDWKTWLNTTVAVDDLTGYALALSKAKAAFANELDAYNGLKVRIATAVQAAQYAAVAAYVDAAWQIAQAEATNAINKSLAEFSIALDKVYQDAPVVFAADTNPIFGLD